MPGVRDSVRYFFVDSTEDDAFVTIVDSESNTNLGPLNKDTVVARALLGAAVGQERDVALPMGKRRLRILEIHKPRHRATRQ
jgi:transcription elongation GreA/GreB family factor